MRELGKGERRGGLGERRGGRGKEVKSEEKISNNRSINNGRRGRYRKKYN